MKPTRAGTEIDGLTIYRRSLDVDGYDLINVLYKGPTAIIIAICRKKRIVSLNSNRFVSVTVSKQREKCISVET